MTEAAVIIGSGKTARDIGMLFHANGYDVTWLVGPAFENDMRTFVQRKRKTEGLAADTALHVTPRENAPIPPPDVVLESRAETLQAKREAFAAVAGRITDQTLCLTNSSSILPGELTPQVAGMHFFYPAALTRFVELVLPDDFPAATTRRIKALADSLGLEHICQNSRSAFFVNRLLLPLQAETVRLFLLGVSVSELNETAASDFLPIGQLQTADEIGIDVLQAGVTNYVRRMPPDSAEDYEDLIAVLDAWRAAGILGKKNKHRIAKLSDEALRSPLTGLLHPRGTVPKNLRIHFHCLFMNTCLRFMAQSICTEADLSAALSSVYGAERSVAEALEELGPTTLRNAMADCAAQTGLSYFEPSRFPTGSTTPEERRCR